MDFNKRQSRVNLNDLSSTQYLGAKEEIKSLKRKILALESRLDLVVRVLDCVPSVEAQQKRHNDMVMRQLGGGI